MRWRTKKKVEEKEIDRPTRTRSRTRTARAHGHPQDTHAHAASTLTHRDTRQSTSEGHLPTQPLAPTNLTQAKHALIPAGACKDARRCKANPLARPPAGPMPSGGRQLKIVWTVRDYFLQHNLQSASYR